jgi:hypothetical protein
MASVLGNQVCAGKRMIQDLGEPLGPVNHDAIRISPLPAPCRPPTCRNIRISLQIPPSDLGLSASKAEELCQGWPIYLCNIHFLINLLYRRILLENAEQVNCTLVQRPSGTCVLG